MFSVWPCVFSMDVFFAKTQISLQIYLRSNFTPSHVAKIKMTNMTRVSVTWIMHQKWSFAMIKCNDSGYVFKFSFVTQPIHLLFMLQAPSSKLHSSLRNSNALRSISLQNKSKDSKVPNILNKICKCPNS